MIESIAMIEGVGVGRRDCHSPVLWFTVTGDGWGALQVYSLDSDVAHSLLTAVYEVHELNGRMCAVERTDNLVKFVRLMAKARTAA